MLAYQQLVSRAWVIRALTSQPILSFSEAKNRSLFHNGG